MKISGARVDSFLKQPDPACRSVLIFGPDQGLIQERAVALLRTVVDDSADPFRVAELSPAALKSDPAALMDEALAMTLTGGRRVVRVHGATDAMTSLLKSFIANYDGDSLVLIEAGELGSRSSLRRLFEQAKTAAALPCYSDTPRSLGGVIAESLSQHGLTAAPDALNFLRENLGADRGVTRNELEKLSIYMASGSGGSTTVTLDDARAAVGDNAATSLDEIVYAALGGDRGGMDRALARAFGEGVTAVSVLRAAARHLQRLILARGLIDGGRSPEQAMAALRPPVIFLFSDRFRAQLGRWSRSRLAQALDLITEAELQCKSSGPPPEAVCGRALMRVAQSAGRGR